MSKGLISGIIIISILLGGAIFLAYKNDVITIPLKSPVRKPVKQFPVTKIAEKSETGTGTRHYQNEEVWDIDWTPDGLPKRVTIHRNASQS